MSLPTWNLQASKNTNTSECQEGLQQQHKQKNLEMDQKSFIHMYLTTLNFQIVKKFCGEVRPVWNSRSCWLLILFFFVKRILKHIVHEGVKPVFQGCNRDFWSETFHALIRQRKGVPSFVLKERANEKTLYCSRKYDCGLYIVPCFELWHTKTNCDYGCTECDAHFKIDNFSCSAGV
jgi:hypothetical protein